MENELKKLVHVPSRIGRDLQRYHSGRRQVVGCIPYRLSIVDEIEVLMVSSQKGEAMLFPKGGWEKDESMQEAALRESLEEAGVLGTIQSVLGQWTYKSKTQDKLHDGYMFPLLVEEELDYWPEKGFRQRKWVRVSEAKELCPQMWMIEALESLVQRLDAIEKLQTRIKVEFQATKTIDQLLQTPCFRQAESRLLSSCNTKTIISKNSDNKTEMNHLSKSINYQQLRRAKTEMSSCRNSSGSYFHGLNRNSSLRQMNTSTCEATVLLDRSNRKRLSENFSIDSKLPSCYLLEVMVEQK